jgi:hypothetical protein
MRITHAIFPLLRRGGAAGLKSGLEAVQEKGDGSQKPGGDECSHGYTLSLILQIPLLGMAKKFLLYEFGKSASHRLWQPAFAA